MRFCASHLAAAVISGQHSGVFPDAVRFHAPRKQQVSTASWFLWALP